MYYPPATVCLMSLRAPVEPHSGGPHTPEERPPQAEHVDWSSMYPDEVILSGPERKEAALTFDDGPDDEWTPKVLDVLAGFHIKATFFVVGRRSERNPDVLQRMVREGHVIGNHSWDHPNLVKLTTLEIRSQIQRTDDTIFKLTGKSLRSSVRLMVH